MTHTDTAAADAETGNTVSFVFAPFTLCGGVTLPNRGGRLTESTVNRSRPRWQRWCAWPRTSALVSRVTPIVVIRYSVSEMQGAHDLHATIENLGGVRAAH